MRKCSLPLLRPKTLQVPPFKQSLLSRHELEMTLPQEHCCHGNKKREAKSTSDCFHHLDGQV
jgi:hypothetical protein